MPIIERTLSSSTGRIDQWLAGEFEVSRSAAGRWCKQGRVLVDGKRVKASAKLLSGMLVQVDIPKPVSSEILFQEMELNLVFEDQDLIVVDKPSGLVVHPGTGNLDGTLINGLVDRIEEGVGDHLRPGIVHRIDKDTSGLLVLAKTQRAFDGLKAQFKAHSIDRRYQAIVWGEIESQTIDAPLGRNPNQRIKFAIRDDGKNAVTHITSLATGIPAQSGKGGQISVIECRLETGRTHQIRVHLKHLGNPLLGDPLYGRKGQLTAAWKSLHGQLSGQLLHAKTLGFDHPNGTRMTFESPIPQQFQDVISFARIAM